MSLIHHPFLFVVQERANGMLPGCAPCAAVVPIGTERMPSCIRTRSVPILIWRHQLMNRQLRTSEGPRGSITPVEKSF